MTLPFIANHGQKTEAVQFYAPTFGGTLFVTQTGEMVYALPGPRQVQGPKPALSVVEGSKVQSQDLGASSQWAVTSHQSLTPNPQPPSPTPQSNGVVLTETLVGGTAQAISGEQQSPTLVNVLRGRDVRHSYSQLPTYKVVSLGEVYPGVTCTLHASGRAVEKRFAIAPGAEAQSIQM